MSPLQKSHRTVEFYVNFQEETSNKDMYALSKAYTQQEWR